MTEWIHVHEWTNEWIRSKFEPCQSEAKRATARSQKLLAILDLREGAGKKHLFLSWSENGGRTHDLQIFQADSINHCTWAPATIHINTWLVTFPD